MAKGLHDLLSKQHKFAAQHETLRPKIQGRVSRTPEDIKELEIGVKSLLISAGKPCRVSEIEEDYRKWFGKKLPFRELGASNSVELLKRIPEACEINDESIVDPLVYVKSTQKSAHIIGLINKSKSKPKPVSNQCVPLKDVFVPFTVQDEIRRILYKKRSVRKADFIKLLEETIDLKEMNLEVSVEMLIRSLPHILINDGAFVKSAYTIEKHEIEIPEELHVEGQHIMPSYRLSYYESVISDNLSALLSDKKQMYVIDIPRYYLQKFGKELQWHRYGFKDLWRFLLLLPGEFSMFMSDSGYVVAPSVVPGTVDIREFHEQNLCGDDVYEEVLEKIRQLILHVNAGLNPKHLISAYETMYFEKLVIRTKFDQFLSELHDLYILRIKETGTSCVLLPCNIYEILKLKEKKSKEVKQLHEPINVMKPGDSLKYVNFGKLINAHNQKICAGHVSFAESPNNFWIRVLGIGQNHQMELQEEFSCLTEAMNQLYSSCSDEYDIPLSDLKINLICAGCVKGEWQRVVVLDVLDSSRLLVNCVDHGMSHKVTMINLKYLPKRFSELPVLAYRATLFNIQPAEREWSFEAILKFRKLTVEDNATPKPLSVLIINRSEEGLMQVVLSELCSRNKVTHIGDKLVDWGYALFRFEEEVFAAMYY